VRFEVDKVALGQAFSEYSVSFASFNSINSSTLIDQCNINATQPLKNQTKN
jgi:hypothetical protein